ncbi:hypothetical protein GQ53DRAFT_84393 [Thozetella sp. PMI_491]|nr:hypothetical protein GQ53DRAFT_84393 [Thozetella sp. PMI_491]
MESLNILVQVQSEDDLGNSANPSWLPRWERTSPSSPQAFWEVWDASLQNIPDALESSISLEGSSLRARGLIIDSVLLFGSTLKASDFDVSSGRGTRSNSVNPVEASWELIKAAKLQNGFKPAYTAGPGELGALSCTFSGAYRMASMEGSIPHYDKPFCTTRFRDYCSEKCNSGFAELLNQCHTGTGFQTHGSAVFMGLAKHYGSFRRFFVTRNGYFGLGPSQIQDGDICAILFGANVPFVLRPMMNQGEYRLVGQCYLYGAMYGEIVEKWLSGISVSICCDIVLV